MTNVDRVAMKAWLEDTFGICLWPAQLQENEPKFREVYRLLVALVEDGQKESNEAHP